LALLKRLGEEKAAFAEYIAKLNAHPEVGKQTIKDFLIMPVQRIPRYTMLLQVCLTHEPQTCESSIPNNPQQSPIPNHLDSTD
jgi:hypothetical protein